jgi:hypothetical protein
VHKSVAFTKRRESNHRKAEDSSFNCFRHCFQKVASRTHERGSRMIKIPGISRRGFLLQSSNQILKMRMSSFYLTTVHLSRRASQKAYHGMLLSTKIDSSATVLGAGAAKAAYKISRLGISPAGRTRATREWNRELYQERKRGKAASCRRAKLTTNTAGTRARPRGCKRRPPRP